MNAECAECGEVLDSSEDVYFVRPCGGIEGKTVFWLTHEGFLERAACSQECAEELRAALESEDDYGGRASPRSMKHVRARGYSYCQPGEGGKDPLTGKYYYGTRKCSVCQKFKLMHDFSPDEADLDASKRCCTSCSQAIVNAIRSLESASTIPPESNSKQNEGDAKDEVPNASIVVGRTHKVFGPDKASFVMCNCGCKESAPASVWYQGLKKCAGMTKEVLDTFVLVKIEPSKPAKAASRASKNKDSTSQKAPLNATSSSQAPTPNKDTNKPTFTVADVKGQLGKNGHLCTGTGLKKSLLNRLANQTSRNDSRGMTTTVEGAASSSTPPASFKYSATPLPRSVQEMTASGISGQSADKDAGACNSVSAAAQPKSKAPKLCCPAAPFGVCYKFWTSGQCNNASPYWGTQCKYRHVQYQEPALSTNDAEAAPAAELQERKRRVEASSKVISSGACGVDVSSNSVKASANTNTITSSITKPDVKTPRKPSADDDVKKRKADHDFTMTKEPKKQKITPTRCTITIDQIVIGKTYPGNVTSTTPYGAFVNIGCGQDGLVHVSELRNGYVANVNSVVNVGDSVQVHNLHTRDNAKILPYKMLWHHVPYYDK